MKTEGQKLDGTFRIEKLAQAVQNDTQVVWVEDDQVVKVARPIEELIADFKRVDQGFAELIEDCGDGLKRIDALEKEQA